jgi:Ni/Fe-hydrogenase subunit HybB-like protein
LSPDNKKGNISLFSPGTFILLALIALGAYSAYFRFSHGLGAATDLKDNFPWGLWIGLDVLAGVALAAGGFTITAVVYIFNLKKYRPLTRPAILTAFIGYIIVILALIIDLGQPLRFWHPLVMWQHKSVMFWVVWCVTLYTTVLCLEFSPTFFERFDIQGGLRIIRSLTFPLVIAGAILSFLHESSLGALYLIVPYKLHEFWYSPVLPVSFFISSVAAGISMVSFESIISSKAFKREPELHMLSGLTKGLIITLIVYLLIKIADLGLRGVLSSVLKGGREDFLFLTEMGIGVIIPMILYSIRRFRETRAGILSISILVLLGVVLNRLNVTIFGMWASAGVSYFPTWMEFSITIGLISLGVLLYRLAVRFLPVFPEVET